MLHCIHSTHFFAHAFILGCISGDIRLVGYGSSKNQGRVEMCYNNQYGTLCSYAWDINEAIVICNQLGFFGKFITYYISFECIAHL